MVDTMITLFPSTSTEFKNNGLGALPDAISCLVTEERNGGYELEMEYPITGKRYSELTLRRIITAKPNPFSNPQPFRIYAISKPINGIVTVNAEHISYDLSGIPVSPFTADSIATAFFKMKAASSVPCPFSFWTDKTTKSTMSVLTPSSIRSLLGGVEGSILDVYGGEYEFDKFAVKLHNNRGANRGVSIRYGKNLTDLKQEENCSSVYTGVYPFWYSEQEGLMTLSEKVIKAEGTFNFTRIYPLDLSQEWQDKPTDNQLRDRSKSYMSKHNIGVPKVSIDVSFTSLSQSEEYKDLAILETVYLCDSINVAFPELGVSATAKCIKTVFNVLTNKYKNIELGDAKSNLVSTLSDQSIVIAATPTKTFLEKAIENATQLISGGLGGYVIIQSSTGGKRPDEILIMDTDNIKTARHVWRWNKGGLGYSDRGYDGPYATAITSDGQIVASFITTGELNGSLIKAGTILSEMLSVEYKNSVTKQIDDMGGDVTYNLTTLLDVNSKAITAEVTRATSAEESMSAQIRATADAISLKVSEGDVESIIAQKADSIRLKANKIAWSSLYSSMSDSGVLKCSSAEIAGSFKCGLDYGLWLKMEGVGRMSGGFGANEYGHIDCTASATNLATGEVYHGIKITGGCLGIAVNALATRKSEHPTSLYLGATGLFRYISSIVNNGDGTITWYTSSVTFENGLLVSSL